MSSLEASRLALSDGANSTRGGVGELYQSYAENVLYGFLADIIKFVTYDYLTGGKGKKGVSPVDGAVYGAMSTAFAQLLTTPLDVLRNQIMAEVPVGDEEEDATSKAREPSYFESRPSYDRHPIQSGHSSSSNFPHPPLNRKDLFHLCQGIAGRRLPQPRRSVARAALQPRRQGSWRSALAALDIEHWIDIEGSIVVENNPSVSTPPRTPSDASSEPPMESPTDSPSATPSDAASVVPSSTSCLPHVPSSVLTSVPSDVPPAFPSASPTFRPSLQPSVDPTVAPSWRRTTTTSRLARPPSSASYANDSLMQRGESGNL
ncbi:hypothetical protein ACHAWF_002869 [Thalassiosira exigua]